VLLIRWAIPSDPRHPSPAGISVTVTVLFPPEVKRRLATIEAATRHALDLARQAAAAAVPPLLDLDRLGCTVEIQSDELVPPGEPSLITDEGTRLWLERNGDG
jgi:hypothetical protein